MIDWWLVLVVGLLAPTVVLVAWWLKLKTPCGAENTDINRTPCQLPQGHGGHWHQAELNPYSTMRWTDTPRNTR